MKETNLGEGNRAISQVSKQSQTLIQTEARLTINSRNELEAVLSSPELIKNVKQLNVQPWISDNDLQRISENFPMLASLALNCMNITDAELDASGIRRANLDIQL